FCSLIVKCMALGFSVAACPDHGFMGVLETAALKVWHRIGLAPDDIIEQPEVQVLHDRANAENIVIGADDPNGAIWLEHTAARQEPSTGEGIISFERSKLVPFIIHCINKRLVWAMKRTTKLKIVGRI